MEVNNIVNKVSESSGNRPQADTVAVGEIWINIADGVVGTRRSDGTLIEWSQLNAQEKAKLLAINTDLLINKSGNRGKLAGSDTLVTGNVLSATSGDSLVANGAITIQNGSAGQQWTKSIALPAVYTVTLGSSWKWLGGSAPEIKANSVIIASWQGTYGIATCNNGS